MGPSGRYAPQNTWRKSVCGISLPRGCSVKVAVIGCGPAGLAAAHAAAGRGCEVQIFAPKLKTPQNGPLLMQRPLPGINTSHPDGTIHQIVINGSILGYRYKLYGDINIGINGDILVPSYPAWRHTETYTALWAIYADLITDMHIIPPVLASLHENYDLVVSTANAQSMCMKKDTWRDPSYRHVFESKAVAITSNCEYPDQPYNTIIFNAGENDAWVRSSNIFGNTVTEWPVTATIPEGLGSRIIQKPISTNCSCFPHVLRTGRFGAFKNETWVDTAYHDTWNAIEGMDRGEELSRIK